MIKHIFLSLGLFCIILAAILFMNQKKQHDRKQPLWQIRSIDTMKYSRDMARTQKNNGAFEHIIEQQIQEIAQTNTTHVAIGTPYDTEYITYLKRWVQIARKYGLHIWFRGNFSGWEGWFDFAKIDRKTHLKLTEAFILKNPDLFEDGDIFTSCPECENGGPKDPRDTQDAAGHRQFLIDEYTISQKSFRKIGKKVQAGFYSMNYDVALLIMDRHTTLQLGNVVVIDHYVKDPRKISQDVQKIAQSSGGKVILGEFGAPIPDIHGNMSEVEQASWIDEALASLKDNPNLFGVNYWTGVGGSTALWDKNGAPTKSVEVIKKYFNAMVTTN